MASSDHPEVGSVEIICVQSLEIENWTPFFFRLRHAENVAEPPTTLRGGGGKEGKSHCSLSTSRAMLHCPEVTRVTFFFAIDLSSVKILFPVEEEVEADVEIDADIDEDAVEWKEEEAKKE